MNECIYIYTVCMKVCVYIYNIYSDRLFANFSMSNFGRSLRNVDELLDVGDGRRLKWKQPRLFVRWQQRTQIQLLFRCLHLRPASTLQTVNLKYNTSIYIPNYVPLSAYMCDVLHWLPVSQHITYRVTAHALLSCFLTSQPVQLSVLRLEGSFLFLFWSVGAGSF